MKQDASSKISEGSSKKGIIRAGIFLTGFVILLFITSYLVRPLGGEVYDIVATNEKIEDLAKEKEESLDVIFAGSSLVFQDISPLNIWELTGITSYDLSDGGMRLCDQYALIQNALTRQSPSILVLETMPVFSDASPYKDGYALPTNLVEKIFPIFHYHIFYKSFHPFEERDESNSLMKGFQPSYDVKEYTGEADYMAESSDVIEIEPLNEEYLEKILTLCRDNDIELVLASMPSPVSYDRGHHDCMSEWAADNGVKYIDLNLMTDELGIDWSSDTKDGGDHLNYNGAKKVSTYLAGYLRDNFDLEDHRTDEAYAGWNSDYEEAGLE